MSLTLRLLASSSALVISSSNSAFGKNCRLRISETRCFSPPDSSAIDLVSVSGESPNRVRSSVNFFGSGVWLRMCQGKPDCRTPCRQTGTAFARSMTPAGDSFPVKAWRYLFLQTGWFPPLGSVAKPRFSGGCFCRNGGASYQFKFARRETKIDVLKDGVITHTKANIPDIQKIFLLFIPIPLTAVIRTAFSIILSATQRE